MSIYLNAAAAVGHGMPSTARRDALKCWLPGTCTASITRFSSTVLPSHSLRSAVPQTFKKKGIRIGRPGYRVVKQRDPDTGARSLLFEIEYPEIEEGLQPRHRFMSAYEQKVEAPDKAWQYLLFAAEPYETIAFKVPSLPVDRSQGRFYTSWDPIRKVFTLQVFFLSKDTITAAGQGRR